VTAKTISTYTENIGAGGICVLLKEDLGLFQGVDVELFLNESIPDIKCGGTIVWVVKKTDPNHKGTYHYDTGIEFIDIRPEDREKMSGVIDEILRTRRQK